MDIFRLNRCYGNLIYSYKVLDYACIFCYLFYHQLLQSSLCKTAPPPTHQKKIPTFLWRVSDGCT